MKRLSLCLTSALCALSFTSALGCSDEDSDGESPELSPLQAAEPLLQDSGMTTRERLVIRDQATWTDTWRKLNGRRGTPLEQPQINFEERVVIVASMGETNSASHSITVDDAEFSGTDATFTITEKSPASGCASLPSISHPVAVVTVARFTGEASFEEKKGEQACR